MNARRDTAGKGGTARGSGRIGERLIAANEASASANQAKAFYWAGSWKQVVKIVDMDLRSATGFKSSSG